MQDYNWLRLSNKYVSKANRKMGVCKGRQNCRVLKEKNKSLNNCQKKKDKKNTCLQEPHCKPEVNSGAPEWLAVPDPLLIDIDCYAILFPIY